VSVEDIARSVEGACWRDDLRKFFEPRYLYTPQFLANPACKKRVKMGILFSQLVLAIETQVQSSKLVLMARAKCAAKKNKVRWLFQAAVACACSRFVRMARRSECWSCDAFTAFDLLCRPADSRAEGPKGCEAAQSRGGQGTEIQVQAWHSGAA